MSTPQNKTVAMLRNEAAGAAVDSDSQSSSSSVQSRGRSRRSQRKPPRSRGQRSSPRTRGAAPASQECSEAEVEDNDDRSIAESQDEPMDVKDDSLSKASAAGESSVTEEKDLPLPSPQSSVGLQESPRTESPVQQEASKNTTDMESISGKSEENSVCETNGESEPMKTEPGSVDNKENATPETCDPQDSTKEVSIKSDCDTNTIKESVCEENQANVPEVANTSGESVVKSEPSPIENAGQSENVEVKMETSDSGEVEKKVNDNGAQNEAEGGEDESKDTLKAKMEVEEVKKEDGNIGEEGVEEALAPVKEEEEEEEEDDWVEVVSKALNPFIPGDVLDTCCLTLWYFCKSHIS